MRFQKPGDPPIHISDSALNTRSTSGPAHGRSFPCCPCPERRIMASLKRRASKRANDPQFGCEGMVRFGGARHDAFSYTQGSAGGDDRESAALELLNLDI